MSNDEQKESYVPVDWLVAKEAFIEKRLWWQRGASLTAFLFLMNSFVAGLLWLTGLADPSARFIAVLSFMLAFFMAALDGAMEKDK